MLPNDCTAFQRRTGLSSSEHSRRGGTIGRSAATIQYGKPHQTLCSNHTVGVTPSHALQQPHGAAGARERSGANTRYGSRHRTPYSNHTLGGGGGGGLRHRTLQQPHSI
jgi:hypothetical protein